MSYVGIDRLREAERYNDLCAKLQTCPHALVGDDWPAVVWRLAAERDKLRAEVAELRKQAEAAATAPSDADVKEWEKRWKAWKDDPDLSHSESIDDIVADARALMRRANAHRPAPAASATLREAAKRAIKARDAIQQFEGGREWVEPLLSLSKEHDEAMDVLRAALAAEPEAQPERTRVVRNAEGGEDIYVFSQDPQRFLMCQEEGGKFTVLFSDRAIGLSHVVELPPSDAALKAQPAIAVPEEVLLYAKEWNLPLDARSDNCASTMTVALWILSLAASGAAPQAAPYGRGRP